MYPVKHLSTKFMNVIFDIHYVCIFVNFACKVLGNFEYIYLMVSKLYLAGYILRFTFLFAFFLDIYLLRKTYPPKVLNFAQLNCLVCT